MQLANGLLGMLRHLRRLSTVIIEVLLTGAALAALHRLGLVGTLPIETILALLFVGAVASTLTANGWTPGSSRGNA